jgi:hypothetical protein
VIRLGIDFETYFDTEVSLTKLSTEAYIAHPKFKVNGCAVIGPGVRRFMNPRQFQEFADKAPWDRVEMVSHNAGFDGRVLARVHGKRPARYVDTMAMAKALLWHRTFSASLDAVSRFLRLPEKSGVLGRVKGMYEHQVRAAGLWKPYAAYALQDCDNCLTIADILFPMLEEHLSHLHGRQDEMLAEAGLADRGAVMSPDRFADLLRTLGEEPETKQTAKGTTWAFARTDPYMDHLLEHDDERVSTLAAARIGCKGTQEQTRTERFLEVAHATGGAFPAPIAYHAAHTGRWGGTDKLNLQNLKRPTPGDPRRATLRRSIVAPPGCVLVIGDLSQIECRMTAYLCGQHDLLDRFRRKEDVYAMAAQEFFGRPVNKDDNPDERYVGKQGELSLGYGCGHVRFANMLRVLKAKWHSEEFARNVVEVYRAHRTRIVETWRALDGLIHSVLAQDPSRPDTATTSYVPGFGLTRGLLFEPGRITLPSSRSLVYPELRFDTEYEGFSYRRYRNARTSLWGGKLLENIVQAVSRDVLTDMQRELMGWCRIALQVHDELVGVVWEGDAEDAKAEFERVMSVPPWWAPDFPMACEVQVARRYEK